MDLKTLDASGRQWTVDRTHQTERRPASPVPETVQRFSIDVNGPLQTHANKPPMHQIDGQKNVLIWGKSWRIFLNNDRDRFSEIH